MLGELGSSRLYDGYFGREGGSMFGVVRGRCGRRRSRLTTGIGFRMAMRPLIGRGVAPCSSKPEWGVTRENRHVMNLRAQSSESPWDTALAEAGVSRRTSTSSWATHCISIRRVDSQQYGRNRHLSPLLSESALGVRRGEWEDATHP